MTLLSTRNAAQHVPVTHRQCFSKRTGNASQHVPAMLLNPYRQCLSTRTHVAATYRYLISTRTGRIPNAQLRWRSGGLQQSCRCAPGSRAGTPADSSTKPFHVDVDYPQQIGPRTLIEIVPNSKWRREMFTKELPPIKNSKTKNDQSENCGHEKSLNYLVLILTYAPRARCSPAAIFFSDANTNIKPTSET